MHVRHVDPSTEQVAQRSKLEEHASQDPLFK